MKTRIGRMTGMAFVAAVAGGMTLGSPDAGAVKFRQPPMQLLSQPLSRSPGIAVGPTGILFAVNTLILGSGQFSSKADIALSRSEDGGVNWEFFDMGRVNGIPGDLVNPYRANQTQSVVAANGHDFPFVVWMDSRNYDPDNPAANNPPPPYGGPERYEAYFSALPFHGNAIPALNIPLDGDTLNNKAAALENASLNPVRPDMQVADWDFETHVYVAAVERSAAIEQRAITFYRSYDNGVTFQPGVDVKSLAAGQVSWSGDGSGLSMALSRTPSQDVVHIVWPDNRNNNALHTSDVYYDGETVYDNISRTGYVVNFNDADGNDDVRVTTHGFTAKEPDVAVKNRGTGETPIIYIVYTDYRNEVGGDGNSDIYFSYSTDNGATWSSGVKVNSDSGVTVQDQPTIAVNQATGWIYLAWRDQREGRSDIYFGLCKTSLPAQTADFENVRVQPIELGVFSIEERSYPSVAVDSTGNAVLVWNDAYRQATAAADSYTDDYILFAKTSDLQTGAPNPPTLRVSESGQVGLNIRVTWDASSDPDVVRYNIYRRSDNATPVTSDHPFVMISATVQTTSLPYNSIQFYVDQYDPSDPDDDPLPPNNKFGDGRRYFYRVTAVDDAGNESVFSEEEVSVLFDSSPSDTLASQTNTSAACFLGSLRVAGDPVDAAADPRNKEPKPPAAENKPPPYVGWGRSVEDALKRADREAMPVLVFFPDKEKDKEKEKEIRKPVPTSASGGTAVFEDVALRQVMVDALAVKTSLTAEYARQFGVSKVPVAVLCAPNGSVIKQFATLSAGAITAAVRDAIKALEPRRAPVRKDQEEVDRKRKQGEELMKSGKLAEAYADFRWIKECRSAREFTVESAEARMKEIDGKVKDKVDQERVKVRAKKYVEAAEGLKRILQDSREIPASREAQELLDNMMKDEEARVQIEATQKK
ncbi:MAG: hypothetical protein V1809_04095 [Planctomycetota bacterium]